MRIPVLAILPAQNSLRESAAASISRRRPTVLLSEDVALPTFEIDDSFAAVPIASGSQATATIQSASPRESENFIVRGFVEAAGLEEVPAELEGTTLYVDPVISAFPTCGGTPPVGGVPGVVANLNLAAMRARGLDGTGVAIAIMDTGINLAFLGRQLGTLPMLDAANSWKPAGSTIPPGGSPVDHGSMCAFDALLAAPNATLLDFPILSAKAPGGSTSGSTLGVAIQGYAQLIAFWSVAFAAGGASRYTALVVNNSWGMYHPSWDFPAGHPGRYVDNPNHPFNSIVALLARSNADIVFAAGNCGTPCADSQCRGRTAGTIMGANAYQEVLTVAGCDTTDTRVGYSSQGPSIAGMFQDKPDIACYTHFLGSQAFGVGSPDSGTSAACPVAAGCIAAIRTKVRPSAVPSANLFAQLTATARKTGAPAGWDPDLGFGILDPDAAAHSMGV